jgi:gamma-glutamyl AIG2-like cyclotransferase
MTLDGARTELLFSYGTLQLEAVQLGTFGRRLDGSGDRLRGYELATLDIDDPAVIALSGKPQHTMARFTGRPSDVVTGVVFTVTPQEIRDADRYEVAAVQRVRVSLESGLQAWAYIEVKAKG